MTEPDAGYEPPHASSPTDQLLTELQLYGYRPFQDDPDGRTMPGQQMLAWHPQPMEVWMRVPLMCLATSIVLLATPVVAAETGDATSGNKPSANDHQPRGAAEQKLHESLHQAGFTDIHIVPQSFIVHAKAKDGTIVTMMIDPDEIAGVIESAPSSGTSAPDTTQHESNTTHAPSKEK